MEPSDDPQWERAHQAWELVVGDERDEPNAAGRSASDLRKIFKILRVKRSEREALASRMPGVVRRGARVDLLAVERALREAGIPCELRRRPSGAASSPPTD